MTSTTIAFIGAGNMASSIIGGLIAKGFSSKSIIATAGSQDTLDRISKVNGIRTTTDNQQAVTEADIVVLAVKPQMMKVVLEPLAPIANDKRPLFISVAAGIEAASIDKWLGGGNAIVRCMPNTPSQVQSGASGLFANAKVTQEQHELADNILRAVGITLWVYDESSLDAVTAVSGSGPAYFFYVMEAMQAAGEKLGLTPDAARQLTLQTALGSAQMAIASDMGAAELRRQVTSPGGTTEQAISVFDEKEVKDAFEQAMLACRNRAEELAKILGED